MKINQIVEEIANPSSIYSDIMDNILAPNFHLKPELISELAISFLTNKKSIEKAYKDGWFKYLFIKAVKNQVHSSTSQFHKNVRQSINGKYGTVEFDIELTSEDDLEDIQYKEQMEKKNEALLEARKEIPFTWFEAEVFRLYYDENMTYRAIEDMYSVDHCSVFLTIKEIKARLSNELTKPKYNI